ncbi:MAG: endonuclease [Bacteroidia bacterium]
MKNKYLLLLSLSVSVSLAQIPAGYYNTANGLTGANLKTALHNIIKGNASITYAQIWTSYDSTDVRNGNEIWDIYSDLPGGTPPYTYTYSTNQCGNYNSEADCYNREHSWPESWFNGVAGPYTDLFHIYPTDGWVNNKRGNYPYGEVSAPTYTSLNGGKLGPNTSTGYSQTVFEPINEYKGDLARGYFYMSTRYMTEDAAWDSSDAVTKSLIKPWAVCLLLKWHHQDLVSAKEINRNNAIYKIQNNRNPFIDHPEYADSIFTCALTGINNITASQIKLSIFPNPANDKVTILFSKNILQATITLSNYIGQEIISQQIENVNSLQLNVSNLAKGMYIIKIASGNYTTQQKLLID